MGFVDHAKHAGSNAVHNAEHAAGEAKHDVDKAADKAADKAHDAADATHDKAERTVADCKGDPEKLAKALAHAPESMRNAARAVAHKMYGNSFVALFEQSLKFLLDSAGQQLGKDEEAHRGKAMALNVQLLEKLKTMKELKLKAVAKGQHELADQLDKLEHLFGAELAMKIAVAESAKWADVVKVLEAVIMVVVAVIVAVAVVVASSWTGSSSLLLIAAVAAVVTLAIVIVQNVPTLLHGVAVVLKMVGGKEAAGQVDQAADAYNREVASQDWFKWVCVAIQVACATLSVVGQVAADPVMQTAAVAGGVATIGMQITQHAVQREMGAADEAMGQTKQQAGKLQQRVQQLTTKVGDLRDHERDEQDRAHHAQDAEENIEKNLDKGADSLARIREAVLGSNSGLVNDSQGVRRAGGDKLANQLANLAHHAEAEIQQAKSEAEITTIKGVIECARAIAQLAQKAGPALHAMESACAGGLDAVIARLAQNRPLDAQHEAANARHAAEKATAPGAHAADAAHAAADHASSAAHDAANKARNAFHR